MTAQPRISVVVPVHQEAAILHSSVAELLEQLDDLNLPSEVLLVENGSRDQTWQLALDLAQADPRVRPLSMSRADYGSALRAGILEARGEFVICEEIDICDADFHARALGVLMAGEADLVVGSKSMRGAIDHRPWFRRSATRVYNGLLELTLGFSGTDTHGLKAFRRARLLDVLDACVVGYDVFASEFVIRAERAGLCVREIPVDIVEKRPPSIALTRRVPRVLLNLARLLLAVRCGLRLGGPSLSTIVRRPSADLGPER